MGFINTVFFEKRPEKLQNKAINILTGTIQSGFQISDMKLAVITHSKTNQSTKKRSVIKKRYSFA